VARIAGVDLPRNKRAEIGLTYIFGVGRTRAVEILEKAGVNPGTRVNDLTEGEIQNLRSILEEDYRVEGALRAEAGENVKRLIAINSYRGLRHKRGLPVHGQRTRTNARSRKGPKKTVGRRKKK
jgi:small subunit ribosomal protein S13